eukprot:CAMPEP_0172607122 /NCGR_PEP_ID=MMETSP1068-20121228/27336_1 /TAXON_ID=35684 /ORGANISM="Pseudopedinella elastica, Strain CCMP716" /LENGTH=276 /DNA_ID=CAMNT_0013410051 /DNA_START=472 /DNA_END=1302 /DNA_ORIENTATION=-
MVGRRSWSRWALFVIMDTIILPVSLGMNTEELRLAVTAWCNDPVAAAEEYGDISGWDTGDADNMFNLFSGYCSSRTSFNEDISSWDTSKVTMMRQAFYEASAFNQDISAWDISKVTETAFMFEFALGFNQVLCWDLTGKDSGYMFGGTGSVDPSMPKCACSEGTFYDGSSCSPCASGTVSYGKTASCITCASGLIPSADQTACELPPPTSQPTGQPTPPPTFTRAPTPSPSPPVWTPKSVLASAWDKSPIGVLLGGATAAASIYLAVEQFYNDTAN